MPALDRKAFLLRPSHAHMHVHVYARIAREEVPA